MFLAASNLYDYRIAHKDKKVLWQYFLKITSFFIKKKLGCDKVSNRTFLPQKNDLRVSQRGFPELNK